MLKFRCGNCKKILLTNTYELNDGKTVCTRCYKCYREEEIDRELKQKEFEKRKKIKEIEKEKFEEKKQKIERKIKIDKLYIEIFEKGAYKLIYNFVKKYPGNTDKKFDTLIKLIEVRNNINVERDIFKDVIWHIKEIYDERIEIETLERELMGNKKDLNENFFCEICRKEIDKKMFYYSKFIFDKSLCLEHHGTKIQRDLFIALKNRDLDCEYESWDGKKYVDMAIHDVKLYIEIDEKINSNKQKQFIVDLKDDKFLMTDQYFTKHISNMDVEENLEDIANEIADLVTEKILK